jgi:hypothetical protein
LCASWSNVDGKRQAGSMVRWVGEGTDVGRKGGGEIEEMMTAHTDRRGQLPILLLETARGHPMVCDDDDDYMLNIPDDRARCDAAGGTQEWGDIQRTFAVV